MLNRHAVPAAALTVVALAGCGSSGTDAADGPTPDPPKRSALTTQTPSPPQSSTPSASTTSTGTAAGAPGVPEPARQHTTKGAIAFAKYYTDTLNKSGKSADVSTLTTLSLEKCKSCANYEGNVRYLAKHSEHNAADQVEYHSARRIRGETGMVINALVDQTKMNVVGADGHTTRSYPLIKDLGLVFFLKWTDEGWRVQEIKIDRSRVK